MDRHYLILVTLGLFLYSGSSYGEPSCTNTCHCDGALLTHQAVLKKLDQHMGVLKTMKQDQVDLKDDILKRLEAQDRKLELSLMSGQQGTQPQNDQINQTRQCDNLPKQDQLMAVLETMKQDQVDLRDHILKRLEAQDLKLELSLTSGQQGTQPQNDQINQTRQCDNLPDPTDCQEVLQRGSSRSGVYRISPDGTTKINVYCEQELDGGGWTVFQHRQDGSVNFYRDWAEYKTGFGELTGEFWLGNDNIHLLTKLHDQKLKIELKYRQDVKYADYAQFFVANENLKYKLSVSGFSGSRPLGDSFTHQNQSNFSTKDQDNDSYSSGHCAQMYTGAWWYKDCHFSNLNGVYGSTQYAKGINWYTWKSYSISLTGTRMMVKKRP